ncbi:hypothetical protein N7532_006526 [Penicillium argentinense]|uniref:Thiamine pyrophosphate enzyme TPP-binding domain-containing protein n=1 Tax=Penicillium argentinense TaxID=1131581 RepID=A0A9W9KAX8_9EURO|nr:uncharacterized protein N7532_006526 [Penicillium argentinense]KAJ5099525.1 hypothetical protein N7532_006526 [Penicillium argentinense]
MEAIVHSKTHKKGQCPEIVTCPQEYPWQTASLAYGKQQAVIVHVDVGTQALGCAVHNASAAYCPVLIFAGLSPYTIDGELRGSRTEYVHWLQDAKYQRRIVDQYCRYTDEVRTERNIKQMVNRALQFAKSDPPGPMYLTAGRENWSACTRLSGEHACFPFSHPASLGLGIGTHEIIPKADVILVVHAVVPWIPTLCRPSPDVQIVHIDIDPLKKNLSLCYILAKQTFRADATITFRQIHTHITSSDVFRKILATNEFRRRATALKQAHAERLAALAKAAEMPSGLAAPVNIHYLGRVLRESLPSDKIWCLETVTNATPITNQLQVDRPGHLMATDHLAGGVGKGKFVCEIVGDGTYMFGSPGTVYWIARRYELATLTIVLNNKGWNATRNSLELVHPTGLGSKVNNIDLNISFTPTPDFPGIAKAAAGNHVWTGIAINAENLGHLLPQAVESVQNGVLAVLEGVELAPHGIRINSISPGLIDSERTRFVWDLKSPEDSASMDTAPPLSRIGNFNDLAGAVIYLLSDASAYTNGADIAITGGLHIGRIEA